MKCYLLKLCKDQHWQDELRFSNWRFFSWFAFVNNHLPCYWPTTITWSQISVLNFKFSVPTFLRLMSSLMTVSIEQKLCEVKIFQLQSMSNVIRCRDKRCAFKNSGISCLAWYSSWAILERQSCTQKIGSRLRDTTSHIPSLLQININLLLSD